MSIAKFNSSNPQMGGEKHRHAYLVQRDIKVIRALPTLREGSAVLHKAESVWLQNASAQCWQLAFGRR